MHVGYDAAECHHHIPGYLKIDLPARVCARVCALLLRTGPLVVYCPFFTLSFLSASVALLMQWCSTRHGAGVGYVSRVHVLSLARFLSPPQHPPPSRFLTHARRHARMDVHIHMRWLCNWPYSSGKDNDHHLMHDEWHRGCSDFAPIRYWSQGQGRNRWQSGPCTVQPPLVDSFIKPISTVGDGSTGQAGFPIHRHSDTALLHDSDTILLRI